MKINVTNLRGKKRSNNFDGTRSALGVSLPCADIALNFDNVHQLTLIIRLCLEF